MASILVIEDTEPLRELIRAVLEGAGHGVSIAATGQEALAQFHAMPADLVIADIYMPDCHGVDLIRRIRAMAPSVIVLAISGAFHDTELLASAMKHGATSFLQKPFGIDELSQRVAILLYQRHCASSPTGQRLSTD
jgi:DNA-binding response OmpR family regulator